MPNSGALLGTRTALQPPQPTATLALLWTGPFVAVPHVNTHLRNPIGLRSMSRPVRSLGKFIPVALVATLFIISCFGDPSGPRSARGYLAVVPSFVSRAATVVPIVHVRAVLTRIDDGTVALDTLVDVAPESDVVDLTLSVIINPPEESFILTLECLDANDEVVFRGGPIEVTATTSSDDGFVEEEVDIVYTGVGYDAADILILDPPITVDFGATVQLVAEVLDSSGVPIDGTPTVWTSLNTQRATVPDRAIGQIVAGTERGPVQIEASTLTGQTDTVTITVEAVPNAITIVSGDNQTGFTDIQLTAPLIVEVTAVDGLGVADVSVDFTTTDGGSFGQPSVLTDAAGQASTTWTLGSSSGTQTATASVSGVGVATFTAVVQGGVVWIAPGDGNWSDGANWSTGSPPGPSDAAIISIDADAFISIDVDATIAGLTVASQTGSATLLIGNNSLTLNGPGTIGSGGEVQMSGSTLGGSGILTVDGRFEWTGGTVTGTGEISVGNSGLMWLQGGAKFVRGGRVIRSFGPVLWTAGDVLAGEGSVLRIEDGGTLDIRGDVTFDWDVGAQSTLVNVGTITRNFGTGVATIAGQFNNFGTLDIRAGTISVTGSNSAMADTVYLAWGAVLDLAGSSQTLNNGLLVTDTSSALAPGTLRISGDVMAAGTDTIATSTDISGTLNIASGSTTFTGSSVTGTVSGSVTIGPAATMEFYQTSGHTFTSTSNISGQGTFRARNAGVTVGGTYSVGLTDITADGIGGMLSFDGANAATTADMVVRAGGERGGAGVLVVTDTFDFQSGDLDGAGVTNVAAGGTLLFTTNLLKTLTNGHTLEIAGVAVAIDGGLRPRGNALIDNLGGGVFDIQTDAFSVSFENTGNRINNSGIFRKSIGTGTNSIVASVPFTNLPGGVVDVQTGTLSIGDFSHAAGAVIQGEGTLALGTITAFEGDVNPGTSPGILSITGDMPQGRQSIINVDLDGATVGTGYDQLNVSGAATLNGELNIKAGFVPTVGNTFTVLTYGSRSGTFANITGLDVGGGVTLQPQWNANSLDLVATIGSPSEILFASDSGGALSVGIYTTDGAGPNAVQIYPLTDLGSELLFPRWSPDRSRIGYSYGTFSGPNTLFVMSAAGDTNVVVVNDTSTYYPKWSPDGSHLGFICGSGTPNIDVCVIPDVTGAIASLPLNNYIVVSQNAPADWQTGSIAAAWDPLNSDRVVFARDSSDGVNPPTSRFFTASFDGTNVQPLHTAILDVGNGPLQVFGTMDWPSDGSTLAFAARDPQANNRIYLMNSDGTGLRQLTFLPGFDDGPLFSPDGSEVLFGRDEFCSYNGWIVDVNNTDGSLERQITDDNVCDFNYDLLTGDWSPDGSQLVLTGFDLTTGWTQIYVVPRTVDAVVGSPNYYRTVRVLVGRDADVGSFLREVQPSWRP